MNKVITTNKKIFKEVTDISINENEIENFVSSLVGKKLETTELNLFKSSLNQSDAFKLTLIFNAMNFCYWAKKDAPKWTIEIEGKKLDGSIALVKLLEKIATYNKKFLDWRYLSKLTFKEFDGYFEGCNIEIPLIKERYKNIISLAKNILSIYKGNSDLLLKSSQNCAGRMLKRLSIMSCFKDQSNYKKQTIFFLKRAQLQVKMYSDIYQGKTGKPLRNIQILTAFADYKVPQLLRHLKILNYSPDLAEIVDKYKLIEKDSKLENEIRISTIVAIEKIKKVAQQKGLCLTSSQNDNILWNRAASNKDQMKPYHRTYTTAY